LGLDYSFRLYFHRQHLWDALQGIADISEHSTLPTLVVFPDHIRAYPLRGFGEKERIIPYNAPLFGFSVTIRFDRDDAIVDYMRRMDQQYFDPSILEDPSGIAIGCIYINVYNDLNRLEGKDWDPDVVLIDMGTPGTRMSTLFFESPSIRRRFQELLENCHGIFGVLNMEDFADLVWFKGKRVEHRIPDPYMSPAEIEAYLLKHGEDDQ
jgi:hypothetical protein